MVHKYQKKHNRRRTLAWLWVTLGALAITAVGIFALSSQAGPSASPTPTVMVAMVSPAEAHAKYQEGAFILDVRTQDEYNQFHIRGSTSIPLDQLPNRLSEVPKDKDIVVVCLSGHRAQSGAAILDNAGFSNVVSLEGGLQAWSAAGYQVDGTMP